MAKIKAPLLSEEAHGSIGGVLTYSQRKSGSQTRFQKGQKDFLSAARINPRAYYSASCGWWNQLTASEQAEWEVVSREET